MSWNLTRFSSYGPVPGYQSPSLSLDVGVAQSLGWRGKRVDETGYINLGARLYDSAAGRFISADPLGHEASQDLYGFCGDPVNDFNPDGRCGLENDLRSLYNQYVANNYIASQAAAFDAYMATGDMSPMFRAIGVNDFFNDVVAGALKGEYATDAGPGAGFGNAVASSVPVWGQIAGARDLSASVGNLGNGGWQNWHNWRSVGIYGLATMPFLGWVKGAARVEHTGAEVARVMEAGARQSRVWRLGETACGTAIENQLAATEYKDWFPVGQLDNGKFPLVDFQKRNTLVSLKTVAIERIVAKLRRLNSVIPSFDSTLFSSSIAL